MRYRSPNRMMRRISDCVCVIFPKRLIVVAFLVSLVFSVVTTGYAQTNQNQIGKSTDGYFGIETNRSTSTRSSAAVSSSDGSSAAVSDAAETTAKSGRD